MYSKTVVVANEAGLHARPATLFTQAAAKFQSKITVQKGAKSADAKSILKVLSLGISQGTEIILTTDGADEREAMDFLIKLIKIGLQEGDGQRP